MGRERERERGERERERKKERGGNSKEKRVVLIFTHHRKFVYSVLPAGNCQTDSAWYVALAVTCFALLQSERKDSTLVFLCARWVMDAVCQ